MTHELKELLCLDVGSPAWTDWFVQKFGFRKEWLKHYGCHFMFEQLDNERRYDEMMEFLNADEERKCFLLHHVHNAGELFYISKEHNVFKDLLNEHVKKLDDEKEFKP